MLGTPFSISPNPVSLYLTPSLKAALHKVRRTIDNRQGLSCILGDAGMGKSSVLRYLYGAYESESGVTVAFVTEPEISSAYAFVKSLCLAFKVAPRRSLLDQKNALKEFIFAEGQEGRNVILLLDEAQGLDSTMLEIVRSFLNYETNNAKLLQIVMAGQLELRNRLKLKANKALKSRIIMYSLLDPLSLSECKSMLAHRCEMMEIPVPFPDEVIQSIYDAAGGVPRDILRFCDGAWELAQFTGESSVSLEMAQSIIEREIQIMSDEVEAA
jgi:type II secretory pathway predicted ATPase ExeA